ncbi:cache, type 2 domain protein [Desulfatibacillum aliphaticivorans]|uniref:Cache, type 2 domain protein n=1 Tax=Desulfatibacillum aliphaticivorans TaxID=218208 RepID=B8FIL1_DESAL|nr:cache domain-containing protein [Desulfatibacillum aliphaticivorans]ACL04001.1 cache, type 2 domain protein [Desulfatibacillum aliphaticivorans]
MKKLTIALLASLMIFSLGFSAWAQESATPQEVYDMVAKAAYLMGELGEDGLAAFNDPNGEFAWKDTYVIVTDCAQKKVVGHPVPQVRQMDPSVIKCKKTGRPILIMSCEETEKDDVQTNGYWGEYWWNKPGTEEVARKVSFTLPVAGTPWIVSAGIWNEDISLDELNAANK